MIKIFEPFREHPLVKRYLIIPKLLYFFLSFAYYSCYTFRPKYLEKVFNIEQKDYGLLAALMAFVTFGGGYFWSYMADRYGKPKLFLLLSIICSGLIFQFFLIPMDVETEEFKPQRIAFTSVVSAFYLFFNCSLLILLDVVVLNMLGKENRELYGRQRLWGSVGYSVISILVSLFEDEHWSPYLNILVLFLSFIAAVMAYVLLPSDAADCKEENEDDSSHASEASSISIDDLEDQKAKKGWRNWDIVVLLSNGPFMFLLLVVFMNGLPRTFMTQFLAPIQKIVFKAPTWVTGLSTFTGVFFEIVIFFFSKDLISALGHQKMLLLAQMFMSIRCILYAFLPRDFDHLPYITIYIELLKGLSFGFMQSAAVQMALSLTPSEMKASAQALYNGVFTGLSAVISGISVYILGEIAGPLPINKEEANKVLVERNGEYLKYVAYISMTAFFVFLAKYVIFDGIAGKRKRKHGDSDSDIAMSAKFSTVDSESD